MHSTWKIFLIFMFFFGVKSQCFKRTKPVTGYVPGVAGMSSINKTNCVNDVILENPFLSNPLECARPCSELGRPKTCYYNFVIERYPVLSGACDHCTPDTATNSICADCQCVPADGVPRMALTINRMMPGPSIQVCLGDLIVVDVKNKIAEDGITIHWHGVFQKDYQYYDGVPFVTQCPIVAGSTFRYQFAANNPGTHFYHAHTGLNKMDGVFGTLVIRTPRKQDPNRKYFDTDYSSHVVIISDWMNEGSTERFPGRSASGTGPTGQIPDSLLINGKGQTNFNGSTTNTSLEVITVEPNTRHRFRLINSFCSVCPGQITIEGHNLTVIETDGQPIKPINVTSIVSSAGERYDFVVETNQPPGAYRIQLRGLQLCNDTQQLGILQYAGASNESITNETLSSGIILNPSGVDCDNNPEEICISKLKSGTPIDEGLTQPETDLQFYIPVGFINYDTKDLFQPNRYDTFLSAVPPAVSAATLDGIIYANPPSPLISQISDIPSDQVCNSQNLPSKCNGNCSCTNTLKFPLNSTVEIILVDSSQLPNISHAFHMHGYAYRVISMGQPFGPNPTNSTISVDYVKQLDENGGIKRNSDGPGKDTLAVPNNGYAVLRIRANNPGFWFFHCHFVYHQASGMEMVLKVGEQKDLPPVPPNFPKCGNFQNPIKDILKS
ncbi:laccase-5-like [Frieseomelitta varia]|uniref:laccase-5-like n=1 Tax=Frieseomelitta varia TaxID=561572 RepID=UPI001CB6968F|nr:laccase-5-like [Frieseomelitta varia]